MHSIHLEVARSLSSQFVQTTGLELLFATDRKSNMLLMKKFVDKAPTPSLGTETSQRQVGQMMVFSPLLISPWRQCWQNVCKHGRTLGILYVSRQIGHFKRCSESFSTSTEAIPSHAKANCCQISVIVKKKRCFYQGLWYASLDCCVFSTVFSYCRTKPNILPQWCQDIFRVWHALDKQAFTVNAFQQLKQIQDLTTCCGTCCWEYLVSNAQHFSRSHRVWMNKKPEDKVLLKIKTINKHLPHIFQVFLTKCLSHSRIISLFQAVQIVLNITERLF